MGFRHSLFSILTALILGMAVGGGLWLLATEGVSGSPSKQWLPPTSCVGHGITAALLVCLVWDLAVLLGRRRCLSHVSTKAVDPNSPLRAHRKAWFDLAVDECSAWLGSRYTFKLATEAYSQIARRWSRLFDDRWTAYVLLGGLPAASGLLGTLWLLRAPPTPFPPLQEGLGPALVGAGETAVVWLLALYARQCSRQLLLEWEKYSVEKEKTRREEKAQEGGAEVVTIGISVEATNAQAPSLQQEATTPNNVGVEVSMPTAPTRRGPKGSPPP